MSFAPDVLPTSLARALDLTGVLCVPAVFQDLVRCADDDERNTAQDGLQTIIEAQASDVKLKRFITGDAAIAWLYLEETRDRPTERGAALSQLATETGVDYPELQQCFAVARAFPPDVRDPYLQKDNKWTWFVNLACRTALEGERWGPAREERIRSLSAECADLNTTATRKRVEAVTGKGEPRVRAALVNQDGSREPLTGSVETGHLGRTPADAESEWRRRVERLELLLAPEQLTDGLLKRFKLAEPGTYPQMVEVVNEHLREKLGGAS